jgi:DNA-binding NarL/FixJ family response regulator
VVPITSVVFVGDGRPEPASILQQLSTAADIDAVEVVESVGQLFDRVKQGWSVVGLVAGELPNLDGAQLDRNSVGQVIGFIVVAASAAREDVDRALRGGAKGFLLADSPPEEFITAIRAVASGFLFVPPAFLHELGETLVTIRCREAMPPARRLLTSRETDVLGLLALGYPNSEIATKLYITDATVRSHVLSILRKLRVRNRTEAVAIAYQQGLIEYRGGEPLTVAAG